MACYLQKAHAAQIATLFDGSNVRSPVHLLSMLVATALVAVSTLAIAAQVAVTGARVSTTGDKTRLVLDLGGSVTHRIFALEGPDRLVVDIPDARLATKLPAAHADDPRLVGLRSGVREGDDLRVVLDLRHQVRVKSFLLPPEGGRGHRLVIDVLPKAGAAASSAVSSAVSARPGAPSPAASTGHMSVQSRGDAGRSVVVAIDAGHGGKDPGATGPRGTREKDVTLAIAKRLEVLVKKEPGMRPYLTRDGDYFVPLRTRIHKARKARADIFVSIHADAFTNPKVRGSSVFTLSRRGASSEAAKWLAHRENSADLVGGVDLSESDDLLATVLLDMSQNATLEHSNEAAGAVLRNLGRLGEIHNPHVQRAGFVVLKSPDVPSMLIETAFISNPQEEKRLRTTAYQERLAKAILGGVKAYFRKYPPPGVRLADAAGERRHTIVGGDTLGEIAKRYHVSLASLRSANSLEGDTIRVGQVLKIPGDG